MIHSESRRKNLDKSDIKVPDDVQKALDDYNRLTPFNLELWFDEYEQCWQFYNVKQFGSIPDEDILAWQMSAPTKGSAITTGIITWLKKYDTSKGGLLDKEELKSNWLKEWRLAEMQLALRQENREVELAYASKCLIDDLAVDRAGTGVVVPITVGWNKKKNKPIMAVPKGTKKRLKRQKDLIKNG